MSGGGGPEGGRAGEEVRIGPMGLEGRLTPPGPGRGIVLFAHGSGSGRLSPRNNLVARGLGRAGLGTLLFDLLTPDEAADRRNVFDIDLLARRLVLATGWLRDRADTRAAPVGYFGASTGAAAALVAETRAAPPVGAVVSRGGRPDLAREGLRRVRAPVLLIVGGLDGHVLALNRQALAALPGVKRLAIVEGAGHLFEEPGTLERVVGLARAWFATHLAAPGPP
jgi:putative phosphoribosyl transferase